MMMMMMMQKFKMYTLIINFIIKLNKQKIKWQINKWTKSNNTILWEWLERLLLLWIFNGDGLN